MRIVDGVAPSERAAQLMADPLKRSLSLSKLPDSTTGRTAAQLMGDG
jgi:hypothetical protein